MKKGIYMIFSNTSISQNRQWQWEVSRLAKYLLDRVVGITATLTSDRYKWSPLYQGELEIPCKVNITVAYTEKGQALIKAN